MGEKKKKSKETDHKRANMARQKLNITNIKHKDRRKLEFRHLEIVILTAFLPTVEKIKEKVMLGINMKPYTYLIKDKRGFVKSFFH